MAGGVLSVLCCFLVPAATLADEFSQVAHYSVRLFSMGTLTIETRTGDIEIVGWDDPHVEIRANKVVRAGSTKKAEPLYGRIKVVLQGADTNVLLRTVYPPRRPWRPFRAESRLTVNFQIHMPYDAKLVLRTVDGDVTLRGLTGQQRIFVNYGDVEDDLPSADFVHSLRARTLLGTVQSDLRGEDASGFDQKLLFLNPYGKQDVDIHVRMGGIWIYSSP